MSEALGDIFVSSCRDENIWLSDGVFNIQQSDGFFEKVFRKDCEVKYLA